MSSLCGPIDITNIDNNPTNQFIISNVLFGDVSENYIVV